MPKYRNDRTNISPFNQIFQLKVSSAMLDKLKLKARLHDVSVRLLILRAVMNEFKREDGLQFEAKIPRIAYDPAHHDFGCAQLLNFIKNFPGLSIEDIVYLRDEIGLDPRDRTPIFRDEEHLMVCFWKLFDDRLISEKRNIKDGRSYASYSVNDRRGELIV